MRKIFFTLFLVLAPTLLLAEQSEPCQRFQPGSVITPPPDLFSVRGKLETTLTYKTQVDKAGNTLYCFVTRDGQESPTLHVHPGDDLLINLKNSLSPGAVMKVSK